jgi:hypothetical protein
VATVSGELGPIIYLCGRPDIQREAKDTAFMTPLMNTVQSNHESSFVYLYFKENCELRNLDMNGNTLLHLAAKSNSVNIARLLRHIYLEASNDDQNLEMNSSQEIPVPPQSPSKISARSNND